MSNVFETEEKRREIQKEIERAQQLLADAHDVEDGEIQSKPDEEYDEGEEILKVCFLQIFVLICNRHYVLIDRVRSGQLFSLAQLKKI